MAMNTISVSEPIPVKHAKLPELHELQESHELQELHELQEPH